MRTTSATSEAAPLDPRDVLARLTAYAVARGAIAAPPPDDDLLPRRAARPPVRAEPRPAVLSAAIVAGALAGAFVVVLTGIWSRPLAVVLAVALAAGGVLARRAGVAGGGGLVLGSALGAVAVCFA